MAIEDFIIESNLIEGIEDRSIVPEQVEILEELLEYSALTTSFVVRDVLLRIQPIVRWNGEDRQNGVRSLPDEDVSVGNFNRPETVHRAPPPGPMIRSTLEEILKDVSEDAWNPYVLHCRFETLHPFIDGNGRVGRMIWAWQMVKFHNYRFVPGFLHVFYYQALQNSRK